MGVICQHLSNFNKQHWTTIKHTMKFLQGTLTKEIAYQGNLFKENHIQLVDWAYSQSQYLKGWSNEKRTIKDSFSFLLHLFFHDYSGLIYDYN
jgi:hypothetical protein